MTTSVTPRVPDSPADKAAAASRQMPAEKKLGANYPPCGHCGLPGKHLVYHCADKTQCSWLRCPQAIGGCGAVIEPSDWSHSWESRETATKRLSHGRTPFRGCNGKRAAR